MKKNDLKDKVQKSVEQLMKEVTEKRKALTTFELELTLRKQKNVRLGDRLRDDIARLLTIVQLKQKQEKVA